jgi:hypothetical protein
MVMDRIDVIIFLTVELGWYVGYMLGGCIRSLLLITNVNTTETLAMAVADHHLQQLLQ